MLRLKSFSYRSKLNEYHVTPRHNVLRGGRVKKFSRERKNIYVSSRIAERTEKNWRTDVMYFFLSFLRSQ
jgi:hypothetical protein